MSLEPLRQAYLERARASAATSLSQARHDAGAEIDAAHQQANLLLEAARREGVRNADADTARDELAAGRQARAILLRAQRDAYDEFRRRALSAVMARRKQPEYPSLLDRLAAQARRQLGNAAAIEVDPPGRGGVIGTEERRRVDYTLPAIADRAIESLGDAAEDLWA